MPSYDLKFADGRSILLCEDCGWFKQIFVGSRGNLRELKAEHLPLCYPPNASNGWCAPTWDQAMGKE